MSRDQRPRRAVMVDTGANDPAPMTVGAVDAGPKVAPPAKPRSRAPLGSVLFLAACGAGGLLVSLLPYVGVS